MNKLNKLIILKNAVAKDRFKITYDTIINNIRDNTIIGLKVSPLDFTSEFFTFIFTRVCNAYCFSSIRGCFIFKSKVLLNIYEILVKILEDFNPKIEIKSSNKKGWFVVYLNGYPSVVYYVDMCKHIYSFFIAGNADRPQGNKDSINYILTMSYPVFEKSFYFNADHILNIIVKSLEKHYTSSTEFIENIEYKLYSNSFFYSNLNSSIKYLNDNSLPFNNTIIDVFSKKNHILNIDHTKDYKLKFTNKKNTSFLKYPIHKGDLIRIIYNVNARSIVSPVSCHSLALKISKNLDDNFKVSSYYQKGFDIKNSDFEKYSTLSYGHDTLLEKAIVAKSSIHIYYQDLVYNIQIYDKGMFMIIGSSISDILYGGTKYVGLDLINMVTDVLIKEIIL